MSRHFAQNPDSITFNPGNAASIAAYGTWACVWKADAVVANGLFQTFDGSNNNLWGVNPYADGNVYWDGLASAAYSATTWYLTVVRKASSGSSTAAVRVDTWNYTSSAWTVTNPGSLRDYPFGPNATMRIGWNSGSDRLGGPMAAQALWSAPLTDANVLTMPTSMSNWMALSPTWAIQLNQSSIATPVLDLTGGGGDQIAISGTTVSADEPAGWSYYTPGGGGPSTPNPKFFAFF